MPFLALLAVSLIAYFLVFSMAAWLGRRRPATAPPVVVEEAVRAGEAARRHAGLRAFVARRLDPGGVTGLVLTLAFGAAIGFGVVLAIVTYLVRATTEVEAIDEGAAEWAHDHATGWSTDALHVVTDVGDPDTAIALALVLGVVAIAVMRDRWVVPFLLCVVGGNALITTTVKELADRARPAIDPVAATLGPSFPSGHSSYSAAFFAAAALVLGRRLGTWGRAALGGAAAALAVAVASSRVLLDVHWVSDVVAGLALGWSWFAICAIAFGGRLLRFGAPAEAMRRAAAS
ncbi:MAG TPA: phosphatase PAP2 family protein [Capillimicrobium sp.]|nr:phosphatase PAP2 family protein [Capillimicrobium sp.]